MHSVSKNICTQKEMSYNHKTKHVCSIWGDLLIIKNSEQNIAFLRGYVMKNVTKSVSRKIPLVDIQVKTWHGIKSLTSPIISCGKSCYNFRNWAVKSPVFRTAVFASEHFTNLLYWWDVWWFDKPLEYVISLKKSLMEDTPLVVLEPYSSLSDLYLQLNPTQPWRYRW